VEPIGKIVIGTVKGDIHDIGKNIAKVCLQSYGYEVIDLGKDVDGSVIAEQAALHGVKLVGLSCLMTTTVTNLKTAVTLIRAAAPGCLVMVGGAVMSDEYAKLVGADYYAKDALAGVRIAEKVFLSTKNEK
ncbi:MAG: cobalamin-dependent protein, partial [Firmicutes bacterium]|nr:cobalamin-dependent protein [Bacillota bacterium]